MSCTLRYVKVYQTNEHSAASKLEPAFAQRFAAVILSRFTRHTIPIPLFRVPW